MIGQTTFGIDYLRNSKINATILRATFQLPGGKACNEFLVLNLVSVYFKLIKEWEKTRGAGNF